MLGSGSALCRGMLLAFRARDKCNENRNDNAELGHDPPHT